MRDTFIKKLTKLAETDESIFLVVGDLGYGVIDQFSTKFPNRFLNAGISEQNMMGVAAGLAKTGYKVFVYSIANFPTMRCYEQIRNDVCYHNLDVTIVAIGAGFGYGTLGYSHFAIEDLSLMRILPNIQVLSPADPLDLEAAVEYIVDSRGPKYLRVGKNGEKNLNAALAGSALEPRKIKSGNDLLILSTGNIGKSVEGVLSTLPEELADRIEFYSISAFAETSLDKIGFSGFSKVVTVEEHLLDGGFGSFVLEYLENHELPINLKRIGIRRNIPFPIGGQDFMRDATGIGPEVIRSTILAYFQDS